MEPVTADIALRPLRLGFLVNPRDRSTIRRAMRLATVMWGGQMCPLIPVMSKLPPAWSDKMIPAPAAQVTRGYIRFFEPDLLIQTMPGQLASLGLDEEPSWSARQRYFNIDNVIRQDIGLRPYLNVGVAITAVYQQLYRDEFQFQKRVTPEIYHFKKVRGHAAAFYEAAYGCFPADPSLAYVEREYREAFGAKLVPPDAATALTLAKGQAGYPLYYTVRNSDIKYAGRSDPSIFIFDPAQSTDLVDFWNFRIFTRDVVPINIHWLSESRELIIDIIRHNHRPLPTNHNGVMIHTAIHVGRSLDLDTVVQRLALGTANLPEHSVTVQGWYEAIWRETSDDHIFRPGACTIETKKRQVQITPSDGDRLTVEFPVQAPDFEVTYRGEGPAFVNTINVSQYSAEKGVADALPSPTFAARDSYPVRATEQFVSREGYVRFERFAHDRSFLQLASPKNAITSWLATKGIEAKPSDAGRVAEQLIASVGGLHGTAIIREKPIVELLNKMARSRREWKDGAVDEYSDKTATVREWRNVLRPINQKTFGRWKTLDQLVENGVLQLGLAPRCSHCTQENWYSLDAVGNQVICSRCTKGYSFPQGTPDPKLFKYRVVGPFATPGYAQGSYSVALTLRFLENDLGGMSSFTYSTGMEFIHQGEKHESDFFAWHHKQRFGRAPREPNTLIGECKSLGAEGFKAADIKRLRAIGTLLPGSYLVASTMKDELSVEERKGLIGLAKWGWTQVDPNPLIVLTGVELFGEGPLSHVWEHAGGARATVMAAHRHIFDFATLADATQQAILGMTSEEVAACRYKRSRALALKRLRRERAI